MTLMIPVTANAGVLQLMQQEVDATMDEDGKSTYLQDISQDHVNFYAISWLYQKGIIQGYPDGTFKGDNAVNRAELVKMVVGDAAGNESNCFPDVKDEWFAKYVCYAKSQGWIAGYPDGTFKPGNNVNRVEAIKIIINGSLTEDQIPEPTAEQMALQMPSDMDKTAWYAGYLRFSIVKELLDGEHVTLQEDGSYQYYPADNMSRKEVAEMLWRVALYIIEREQFAFVMSQSTCYWARYHDATTEEELNEELTQLWGEGGFSPEEMNALIVKYESDTALQEKITADSIAECGAELSTQETTEAEG